MKQVDPVRPRTQRSRNNSRRSAVKNSRMRLQSGSTESVLAQILVDPNGRPSEDFPRVVPLGFFGLDRTGSIVELNETGADMLGFPANWLLGRAFVVFVARQDVSVFLDFLRTSRRNPEKTATLNLDMYVDQRTLPAQVALTTFVDGRSVVHRLTVVDISEVRQTENLLEESLSRWYSLVRNAPDVIMTLDKDGRVSFVNKPFCGYSPEAVIGGDIVDFFPEADRRRVRRCLDQSFRFMKRTSCEVAGLDGNWNAWYSLSFGAPHHMPGGRKNLTLVIREISEHKLLEESLRASGDQLRDLAVRVEAVREEERTRVAREIHDELGQALTALKLELSWIQKKKPTAAETRKKLNAAIAQVDDTIDRVRRISSELRPSILDDLGLLPAIEWQVAQFRKRTKIRTELVTHPDKLELELELELELSMDTSIAVFRVVQEALTNVMRHARASRVVVTVESFPRRLRISIADNGVGTRDTGVKSLGIVGMKERIARLRGEFMFVSEPGKGTRVDFSIPIYND